MAVEKRQAVIVGGGASGLMAAVQLGRQGIRDVLLLEKGKEAKIEQRLTIEPSLQAPVEKGAVAGYVEFYVDGELQTKVPVRVTADNGEIGFPDIFSRVLKKLLAFA